MFIARLSGSGRRESIQYTDLVEVGKRKWERESIQYTGLVGVGEEKVYNHELLSQSFQKSTQALVNSGLLG